MLQKYLKITIKIFGVFRLTKVVNGSTKIVDFELKRTLTIILLQAASKACKMPINFVNHN